MLQFQVGAGTMPAASTWATKAEIEGAAAAGSAGAAVWTVETGVGAAIVVGAVVVTTDVDAALACGAVAILTG
jgi:hypothetical protein